jgi:anti-sigma regulatory factor (Ser/Thr protein kinase)
MGSVERGVTEMVGSREPAEAGDIASPGARGKAVSERDVAEPSGPRLKIHSAGPDWVELSLPCSIDAADQLNEFLVWFFADLQEEVRESVRTALRELLLNAIEWGGKSDLTKRVQVAILRGRRVVLCRIMDPGNGFRIENLTHAAICNPDDNPCKHMLVREQKGLRPGGFGLTVVRGSTDELIFNDVGNEVVFLKYLEPPAATAPAVSSC